MKDNCDQNGVQLEAIRMEPNYITLPKGAERDRELDNIIGNIQKASEVGVKIITYHWTVIPIRRNRETSGRGKSHLLRFQARGELEGSARGKVRQGKF